MRYQAWFAYETRDKGEGQWNELEDPFDTLQDAIEACKKDKPYRCACDCQSDVRYAVSDEENNEVWTDYYVE